MIDVSILNDVDFRFLTLFFLACGLVSWFMAWGVSYVISLFIKIIGKE